MANPYEVDKQRVPLPPKGADVLTTACDYCVVGCGYKVIRWPVGLKEGGLKAGENGMGLDFPRPPGEGGWVSPNMHNIVSFNGKPHHVLIVPDWESTVVNIGGAHSIRGGAIAQKCYNPTTPTADRLKTPLLRVNGKLVPISWDAATDIAAQVGNHVISRHGENAWAMKMYSYQFVENTYALTKLAWRSVETVAFAFHDNPSNAPDTPGFRDVGLDNFAASYEDWGLAETLYIGGTDPFETKTIIFESWIMPAVSQGRQKLIFALPRKTTGVAFAEANGGLFLQLIPGSDTALHMAIARVILENGWEDAEWIAKYTSAYSGSTWEVDSGFGQGTRNTDWQWRTTWGGTLQPTNPGGFKGYKEWILKQEESKLDVAEKITGVPKEKIIKAAELMAKPRPDGTRPKTSIAIEKGLYWSNNYLNTASIASLGLLCGAGNRPGQMISRMGGHQRGGDAPGGEYPVNKSPEKMAGRRRQVLDLDRWLEGGNVRFAYVIGTTWIGSMTASHAFEETFRRLTRANPHQITSTDTAQVIETLKRRADSGGMVIVDQDIYLRNPIGTEFSDLVLPAATWGEVDFARANGERRWRLYPKFMDPPGEAKPDFWIVGQIATKMGFPGYDWNDSNQVFEELARFTRGSRQNVHPLVWLAKQKGMRAHELLRSYGTEGIQGPIFYGDGKLWGTKRLHDSTAKFLQTGPQGVTVQDKISYAFNTQSGKANFMLSPWKFFWADFYEWLKPKEEELWVINGRRNEVWQSGFDDVERRPFIQKRWPEPAMEIHPDDAKARGIETGDYVEAVNERVAVQQSGFQGVKLKDLSFTELMKNGHIKIVKSDPVQAVAIVTDAVRPGVAFMGNLDPRHQHMANALVPRVPDPISDNYRFKLGIAKIRKIGESPYKTNLEKMSLAPRTII